MVTKPCYEDPPSTSPKATFQPRLQLLDSPVERRDPASLSGRDMGSALQKLLGKKIKK